MENVTENLRKQNITVSLHEKNNIYQAVINIENNLKNHLICKNELNKKMMNKLKSICYLEKNCI